MNSTSQDNGEALCAEILANARSEAERLISKARSEAAALLTATRAGEETSRIQRLEKTNQEAAHHRDRIRATIPVESRRLHAARVEARLQSIRDEVHRRLLAGEGFDPRETLVTSAAYAISHMSGTAFVIGISPANHTALNPSLAEEIIRRVGNTALQIEIVENPSLGVGDVVIRDREGRQEWDNRLTARLERMWPELRLKLAEKGGP